MGRPAAAPFRIAAHDDQVGFVQLGKELIVNVGQLAELPVLISLVMR